MMVTKTWQARHVEAMRNPIKGEKPIVQTLDALKDYAFWHKVRYDSLIGEDGVLGQYWADIANGLIGLLNGETGRLDCGLIDGQIRELAKVNEVDEVEQ